MMDHNDFYLLYLLQFKQLLCVSLSVYIHVCLWETAPLSPLPCNSLGLGWQSRPDKWTQIVSGDWRGVSALPSITPHLLLVSDRGSAAWWMDAPLYFYQPLTTCSLSFFSSFSNLLLPASFCNLSLCSLSPLRLYHPVCLSFYLNVFFTFRLMCIFRSVCVMYKCANYSVCF